mgnify:CR=1 FL=1
MREVDAQTMESKKVKGLYLPGRFWMSMASAAVIISSGRGPADMWLGKRQRGNLFFAWTSLLSRRMGYNIGKG